MNRAMIKSPPELLLRCAASNCSKTRMPYKNSSHLACARNQKEILITNKVSDSVLFHRRYFKAAFCTELNKPLIIDVKESQKLNSGEVRIQVKAVGVNFGDLLMLTGEYQVKLPLPFIPGSEMSGVVLEVADDVSDLQPGMNVVGLCSMFGAYAEEVITLAASCWKMPEKMTFREAAAFVTSYGTAMMGLVRRASLQPSETVLVTAAAGAVGLAAVDIASNVLGARVVGAVGSDEKCDLVKAKGAADAINYQKESVKDKVKELCPGGVDVVFDAVGGSIFKDALRCIAFEGRLIIVGFASGGIPQIPANHLLVKNVSAIGLYWGSYSMMNADIFKWSISRCFEEYNKGTIKPHICKSFDLSEINNAFDFVKTRKSTGKVVVEIR